MQRSSDGLLTANHTWKDTCVCAGIQKGADVYTPTQRLINIIGEKIGTKQRQPRDG